jgi:hypothetical protein
MSDQSEPSASPQSAPSPASAAASSHWSESFVEHLRTVHFALSILAVAIIFTLLVGKEYDPQTALNQAMEIRDVSENWGTNMVQLFDNLLAGQQRHYPIRLWLSSYEGRDSSSYLLDISKEDLMTMSQWQSLAAFGRPPSSAASFRSWWNNLHKGLDIPIPEIGYDIRTQYSKQYQTNCQLIGPPRRKGCRAYVFIREFEDNVSVSAEESKVDSVDCSRGQECYFRAHVLKKTKYPYEFDFSITASTSHIDERSLKSLHGDWKEGDFDTAFPDLTKAIYPSLEYVELKDLPDRLKDTSKGDQVIEAFGLKIAATDVTRLGLPLLLAAQFYFWLHLHELTRRILPTDPGRDVAWIGIYQSWLAFATVVGSACLLPLVAASLAASRLHFENHPYWQGVTAIAAFLVSLCIAVLTVHKLYKLRGKAVDAAAPDPNGPIGPTAPTTESFFVE